MCTYDRFLVFCAIEHARFAYAVFLVHLFIYLLGFSRPISFLPPA